MNKKRISIILSGLLMMTMVSCTNKDNISISLEDNKARVIENIQAEGTWATDYSRNEVQNLHEEILHRIEDICTILEVQDEYSLHEEVKDENGTTVNRNGLYLEIPEPESNRIESMTYELVQYGNDLSSGKLVLKIGFNLDNKGTQIVHVSFNGDELKFENTAIKAFSEAFTGEENRDYTELNKEIYDIITNSSGVNKIENKLDGLSETITITDDYLIYTLESKEYNFK